MMCLGRFVYGRKDFAPNSLFEPSFEAFVETKTTRLGSGSNVDASSPF